RLRSDPSAGPDLASAQATTRADLPRARDPGRGGRLPALAQTPALPVEDERAGSLRPYGGESCRIDIATVPERPAQLSSCPYQSRRCGLASVHRRHDRNSQRRGADPPEFSVQHLAMPELDDGPP